MTIKLFTFIECQSIELIRELKIKFECSPKVLNCWLNPNGLICFRCLNYNNWFQENHRMLISMIWSLWILFLFKRKTKVNDFFLKIECCLSRWISWQTSCYPMALGNIGKRFYTRRTSTFSSSLLLLFFYLSFKFLLLN